MALASMIVYNELNGEETRAIAENRFRQFLEAVPYFQRHLTLPRLKITVEMKVEVWADKEPHETLPLSDKFQVVVENDLPAEVVTATSVDSTAPGEGYPADQLREMHGLPIPQPARGSREIGAERYISDEYVSLEGREVEGLPGLKISRTGSGVIDGMPTSTNATIAKIDQGPAGLRSGAMNRDAWHFGGGKK